MCHRHMDWLLDTFTCLEQSLRGHCCIITSDCRYAPRQTTVA